MDFEHVFGSSPELDLHNDATSSLLRSEHSVPPGLQMKLHAQINHAIMHPRQKQNE